MYKEFFGLKENPFTINTDPRYLYYTRHTHDALSCLKHGVEARKGFILLTGEVGTGKTTLLNTLLDSLREREIATAFIFNPRLTPVQLFDYLIADFGISCKSRSKSQVLFKLHQWLLDRYQAGEKCVLVVDEAQNLSRHALEEIRLLTNLETTTDKLLQIVLAGQPELEQKLDERELRQLRQRIALRAKTQPLTLEDTCGYICERLRIAGSNGEDIFTLEAIEAVHKHARGIPRVTNLIGEHALIRAFAEGQRPIPREIVDDVSRDFSLDERDTFEQQRPSRHPNKNVRDRRNISRSRAPWDAADSSQVSDDTAGGITQSMFPLFVYGCEPDGTPFYEEAQTIATSVHGGLISLKTPVQPGQRLLLTNRENECSQECVVEFLGPRLRRGFDVAFEFPAPAPHFWSAREAEKDPTSEEACA
jgi:type II secretory pathway predicted ATPase ExeA